MRVQIVFLLLSVLELAIASRILFLLPTLSKSHMILHHALSSTLAERGHDVTVVSVFELDNKIENHREILVPFDHERLKNFVKNIFKKPNQSYLKILPEILEITFDLTFEMAKLPEFKRLLEHEKFDLLIVGMFYNHYLLGYGEIFDCPTAMLSTFGNTILTNSIVANPGESSAVPSTFSNPSDATRMTFTEKVKNFMMLGAESLMFAYLNYKMKIVYE